ncbi:hypothetical protein [Salinarimonas rosea]|uniref:hypothetical protein n=1 Tax=Salinarimonas rosea TaxID=552063 RepID=UPI000422A35C|nr:hypothetical protein [Salinarimonas rosea]
MNRAGFDDEILMAYADGELDPERAEAVAQAAAADPHLADRIATYRDTARVARDAKLDAEGDDLQERIARLVREAAPAPKTLARTVDRPDPFLPARRARAFRQRLHLPMAASVVLALLVGSAIGFGLGARGGGEEASAIVLAGTIGDDLASVLTTTPSGGMASLADGRALRAVATFRDRRGDVCRELEIDGASDGDAVLAVACRRDETWSVRFSMTVPASGAGYVPAGSLETLDAFLADIDAGEPLDADAERAALAAPGGG